jgi:hypothetical protein
MKNEGALKCVFQAWRNLSVRCVITSFTPGACPASRSGRCQGIGHAGKNMPCPSSAMSSGRLFLDRVGRHQSPSPLCRQGHHKTLDHRIETNYHRTARCGLTGCLTLGVHPKGFAFRLDYKGNRRSGGNVWSAARLQADFQNWKKRSAQMYPAFL